MIALALLGGCWPMIPGTWEDYDVPDSARVFGVISQAQYVGDYWDGPTSYNVGVVFVLEDATTTHTAGDLLYPTDGCRDHDGASTWADWFLDALATPEDDEAVLEGDPKIVLPLDDSLFIAEGFDDPSGTYDLQPIHLVDQTYAVTEAMVMPAEWDFDLDDYDDEKIATAELGDLDRFSWDARDDADLYGSVTLSFFDGTTFVQELQCAAPLGAGEVEMDLDALDVDKADVVYITASIVRTTATRVDGGEFAAHFEAVRSWVVAAKL